MLFPSLIKHRYRVLLIWFVCRGFWINEFELLGLGFKDLLKLIVQLMAHTESTLFDHVPMCVGEISVGWQSLIFSFNIVELPFLFQKNVILFGYNLVFVFCIISFQFIDFLVFTCKVLIDR